MPKFILPILAFTSIAFGAARPMPTLPEWNPTGESIYRLVRMDEPYASESNAHTRYQRQFGQLMRATAELKLPADEYSARMRLINEARDILTSELYHSLYDIFLTVLRNKHWLHFKEEPYNGPSVPANYQKYVSTAENPFGERDGAGLAQLALLTKFRLSQFNPETEPQTLLELCRAFDRFLVGEGITGFGTYVETYENRAPSRFPFSENLKQLRLAVFPFLIGASCAGVLSGIGHQFYERIMPAAEQRIESLQPQSETPEVGAERAAEAFGREIQPSDFLPPAP